MKRTISIILIIMTLVCMISTLSLPATAQVVSQEGRFGFKDVKSSHWYYNYVRFCYANGIIKGMDEYTFAPNNELTRAQFVVMLASLEDVDLSVYTDTSFSDVKADYWYAAAAEWAYREGYVSGMSEGVFGGSSKLTREQFSRIMWQYMLSKGHEVEIGEDVLNAYRDKDKISYWALEAMKYCKEAGLINGTSNDTIAPRNSMTRAMVTVVFHEYLLGYRYADCEHSFSEADCVSPVACTECGLVTDLPLGHRCETLGCNKGGVCTVCGAEVSPDPYFHDFSEATCTEPSKCKICGEIRGTAKAHTFRAATCDAPKVCTACGKLEGERLGHTTSHGKCGRCGADIFPDAFQKLIYYLRTEGVWKNGYSYYDGYLTGYMGRCTVYMLYNNDTGNLYILFENEDGDNYSTMLIDLTKKYGGTKFYFEHIYYNYETDLTGSCVGYLNPMTGDMSVAQYEGPDYMRNWFDSRSDIVYERLLETFDYYVGVLCDGSIFDFGFRWPK